MRQPWSAGRQIAIRGSSNRRATWRASASIAPAVSVVSSTSRVRSNSRVTSLRRAIASRARSCAAADRLLAITATTRNANSAIQFCGSAIVNVPTRRQEEEVERQHRRPARRDRGPETAERRGAEHDEEKRQRDRRRADVGQQRSRAAAAATAARLAMSTARSRNGTRRMTHRLILTSRVRRGAPADFLSTLYAFLTGSRLTSAAERHGRP